MAGQFDNIYADLGNVKPAPGEPIPDDVVALDQRPQNFADIEKMIYARAAQQDAARREMMQTIQKQEGALGQGGMNPLDRASMLFQAAGALAAPTRSGAFMESFGKAGSELAGPLSKAAQAERDRQEKIMQLQLARQKLALEASGVNPSDILALRKAQEPSEFQRVLSALPTDEDRAKALRIKAGLEEPASKKGREISDKTLSDLSEAGTALTSVDDLQNRFQPGYSGKMFEAVANVQNWAGLRGLGDKDQAQWWSDYAERRNVLRNTLFGSAVTKNEKTEFEKADISPGMDPEVVKTKLARQRELARLAAYKLANAKVAQGFDPAPIEAALGMSIADIAPRKGGGPEPIKGAPKKPEKPGNVIDFGDLK